VSVSTDAVYTGQPVGPLPTPIRRGTGSTPGRVVAPPGETPAERKRRLLRDKFVRTPADPYGALVGDDRDAAIALTELFKQYGLESLAPQIIKMIQDGFSSDTIAIQLQQTKEYKQRFAANDVRAKNGLSVLSPAEYIATERSYRQIMSNAGLPIGFYDQTSDFTNFLSADVSPTEVKQRVDTVTEAINKAPAATKDYFKQWYNEGDMIAFALDPKRAQPLIDQRIKAAEAAAIGEQTRLNLSQANAEAIGATGASLGDIQTGVNFIGQEQQTTDKLSSIYGGEDVTQADLVQEVFQGGAGAKRKKLASQERATFSGGSGQTKSSLSTSSSGSI
jgi:hypothetical protein